MFKNLNADILGVNFELPDFLDLAMEAGFEGIDVTITKVVEIAQKKSIKYVKELFKEMKPGVWCLPFDYWAEETNVQENLNMLEKCVEVAGETGLLRCLMYISPFSDELDFKENFEFHVRRFKPIARILEASGCRLGLEFLGPKSLREGHKYEFIHTQDGMYELAKRISPNTGLVLDTFHWYTSSGTVGDIRKLDVRDIIDVHINDAHKGIPVDKQIDTNRCLPGESGVIDLVGFLRVLQEKGYDGPVTPAAVAKFHEKLKLLNYTERARINYNALMEVWTRAFDKAQ